MGEVTGTGVMKKVMRRIAIGGLAGMMVVALVACGSSKSSGPANLQDAINKLEAGDVGAAKSELQSLVKSDPGNKYGWYNLGYIAENAGNSKDAKTDYMKAIGIDPKFEAALYNLGYTLYGETPPDNSSAITYLRRAIAVTPGDASAHWYLGWSLIHLGNPKDRVEATKELNAALKINPALFKTLTGSGGTSGVSGVNVPSTTVGAGGTAATSTTSAAVTTTTVAGP